MRSGEGWSDFREQGAYMLEQVADTLAGFRPLRGAQTPDLQIRRLTDAEADAEGAPPPRDSSQAARARHS